MRAYQRRRKAWVALSRGLRTLQRHHLSLLSLAVLATALAVALTNSGFEVESGSIAPAEAANSAPSTSANAMLLPTKPAGDRVEVYYIVDSVDQIDRLKAARQNDALYLTQQSLPPLPPADVYFLLFDSPETEAIGSHFLSQLAEAAPYEGFRLEIVDLTR